MICCVSQQRSFLIATAVIDKSYANDPNDIVVTLEKHLGQVTHHQKLFSLNECVNCDLLHFAVT